jgi:hypothetical protein
MGRAATALVVMPPADHDATLGAAQAASYESSILRRLERHRWR